MAASMRMRFGGSSTHHLVLLDWDDTLMPTTYLMEHIDFAADPASKRVRALALKPGSKGKAKEIRCALHESGSAALRMLRALYSLKAILGHNMSIVIVTNGLEQWLWNSLTITAVLCPMYRQIELLLQGQSTEIVFARNHCLHHDHWKLAAFNVIFSRLKRQKRLQTLNVITVGDQWTDHILPSCGRPLCHHQIKLFPAANARYLAAELNVVADIWKTEPTRPTLLRFARNEADQIIIEFEGYVDDDDVDSVHSLDSPNGAMTRSERTHPTAKGTANGPWS